MRRILLAILLLIFITPVIAQEKDNHEINSEVKELTQFHEVIFKIWHTGWQKKDMNLLYSLTPDVESGYLKIKSAELPGILRDKKSKWDDGVTLFGGCVDLYKVAALKKDSAAILNAAEKLHAQYESLVRILRPPLKEAENFHQTLYMLYHKYMPKGDYDKIKEAAAELGSKIDPLKKAELPQRFKGKEKKFTKSVNELAAAVDKLNETVKGQYNKKAVNTAIEKVHSKYEMMGKIFE